VINLVQAYAKSYCEELGHPYTSRTIIVTAMSGVAATLLHGETCHSVFGLNRKGLTEEEKDLMADTRLVIVDEVSFASDKVTELMQLRFCEAFRELYGCYGKQNVVFVGDYSQLEPIPTSGKPVYEHKYLAEWHGSINCFIELDGRHRFKHDPVWGEILGRFREGCPTLLDIQTINEKCGVSRHGPTPRGTQVASYVNKTRDFVNNDAFERYCEKFKPPGGGVLESACVIFMDCLEMCNSGKVYTPVKSNALAHLFYSTDGEDDCKVPESLRKG
jgi:hypothetical protein